MITYKKDSKDNLQSSDSSMPVLAMCYDFDKTLTPDDMQAQGFIQSVGYNEEQIKQFWHESNQLAKKHDMDNNLAYMYKMIQEAVGHFYVTKDKLMEYGNQVELYEGVRTWFERIRQYGLEQGVKIEAVEVTIASHEFERAMEQGGQWQNEQQEEQTSNASKARRRVVLSELEAEDELSSDEILQVQMMKQNGTTIELEA